MSQAAASALNPTANLAPPSWRHDCLAIIDRLFAVTPTQDWNLLLDLRIALLTGTNWTRTLDLFLACREHLEADHYLPFYRLRRLIATSLSLEIATAGGTRQRLAAREFLHQHRSLAQIEATLRRDRFEHDLSFSDAVPLALHVEESR